jgi:hypothetical protein
MPNPMTDMNATPPAAGSVRPKKTWHVTRIVEEKYSVEAESRAEAIKAAQAEGDPFSVTVKREKATPVYRF